MSERIATFRLMRTEDVFALRQGGRKAAAAIDCDGPGQVRLATVLSELGREALAYGTASHATFSLVADGSLVVEIDGFPDAVTQKTRAPSGLDAARKLMDVSIRESGTSGCTVSVTLRATRPGGRVDAAAVRDALAHSESFGSLDEMRRENQNMVATLQELGERQEQLVRLNAELEETNRGVMAMYAQLADELEETNRGVVALYAELDDKTVQLKAASESKSRFLASVSHELRSPINSVVGLARLLLDGSDGDLTADQRKEVSLIGASAKELLGLVNELLDLAKAESGRLEPEIARVDLAEVFSELRGALRPLVRPGVELRIETPQSGTLETDRALFVHVLRNLLTNALKFTPAGSVRLSAQNITPYEWEFSVADSGIGIASRDHERIFEEFFQVRGALQAQHKGTGLGLPYARRVTQALGGTLRLVSTEGAGSTFFLTLPAAWQPLLSARESPGRQPAAKFQSLTVITIDDDDGFRLVLRGMLQGAAGQILEARGGMEGLRIMRETRPDIAFLDLRMPDMDGTSVLLEIRADPALCALPVIIVSSVHLNREADATLSLASALLSKANLSRETVQAALADALQVNGDTS